MAVYLLKFVLCSGLLLLAYHMLLKNKTTYQFNRVYLLLSLVFSLAIPFISIKQTAKILTPVQPFAEQLQITPVNEEFANKEISSALDRQTVITAETPAKFNYKSLIVCFYGIITLILLGRFARNINLIRLSIQRNEKLSRGNSWLILIDEKLTPHTFLKYIFINRDEYANDNLERDVLNHELTHARQLHSADVIFVELLQVFFWFNPLIILYRRAMQLNHEFIADAAVLKENYNITGYQHLLLEKIGYHTGLNLSSQFNYSSTKKRLIMMAKNTPKVTRIFVRLAIIPVMALAFVLFCTKIEAQQQRQTRKASKLYTREYDTSEIKPPRFIIPDNIRADKVFFPATDEGVSTVLLDEYKSIADKYEKAANGRVAHPEKITNADKSRMIAIYQQMSIDQQQAQSIGFVKEAPLPPLSDPRVPTQQMLDTWKASGRYEIWLNLEKIKNNAILADYKPSDFYLALIFPQGRIKGKKSPRKYRVIMQTNSYYKAFGEWKLAYKPKTVMIFRYPVQQENNNSSKTGKPAIGK